MDSGLISKIEKARIYATESDRVILDSFSATFRGNHNDYKISCDSGKWHCSCSFFASRGLCSHTMATQRIMADMLPGETQTVPTNGI